MPLFYTVSCSLFIYIYMLETHTNVYPNGHLSPCCNTVLKVIKRLESNFLNATLFVFENLWQPIGGILIFLKQKQKWFLRIKTLVFNFPVPLFLIYDLINDQLVKLKEFNEENIRKNKENNCPIWYSQNKFILI